MIDWATAWERANEHVRAKVLPEDHAVIDQARTHEYDLGWLFFYDSARYLEGGERRQALVGNVPFVIDRRDGSVRLLRTNWRVALSELSERYRAEVAAGWVDSPPPPSDEPPGDHGTTPA